MILESMKEQMWWYVGGMIAAFISAQFAWHYMKKYNPDPHRYYDSPVYCEEGKRKKWK